MQTYLALAVPLLAIIAAAFGGYLAGYMKKKGENLATREDIDKVFAETKRIEAKISDEVWDRQKRWELKRDLLLDTIKRIAACKDALTKLHAVGMTDKQSTTPDTEERGAKRTRVYAEWNNAADRLDESIFLLDMACGGETIRAVGDLDMFTRRLSVLIHDGKPEAYLESAEQYGAKLNAVRSAMRKEIGIVKTTTP